MYLGKYYRPIGSYKQLIQTKQTYQESQNLILRITKIKEFRESTVRLTKTQTRQFLKVLLTV
jgi:hypothetical protein